MAYRILIVDDEPILTELLSSHLNQGRIISFNVRIYLQ